MKKIIITIILCLLTFQGYGQKLSAFVTFTSKPSAKIGMTEGVTKSVHKSGEFAFSIESSKYKVWIIYTVEKEWPSSENFYPPNTIDLDEVIPTFKSDQEYYNYFNELNEKHKYIYFFDKNDWKNGNYVTYQVEFLFGPPEVW